MVLTLLSALLGLIGSSREFTASAFMLPSTTSLSPSWRILGRTETADTLYSDRQHTERAALQNMHDVDGLECRAVTIGISTVGEITVLEATARAQETLVEEAIKLEDDIAGSGVRINAGDVYGSVLWPSASAVANYVLSEIRPFEDWSNTTILELGTGSGLVSIAFARSGAIKVIASDYESVPLRLLKYAESHLNPSELEPCNVETLILDICDMDVALPEADLVVAADVMYESTTGEAMAHRTVEALKRGSRVVVGCSPGRPGRPAFVDELKRLQPRIAANFIDTVGIKSKSKSEMSGPDDKENVSVLVLDLDPKSCSLLMTEHENSRIGEVT